MQTFYLKKTLNFAEKSTGHYYYNPIEMGSI